MKEEHHRKPTWSNAFGYWTTSVFFALATVGDNGAINGIDPVMLRHQFEMTVM